MSGYYPRVQGYCPACMGRSLFLGEGGYVTCSRSDCTDPTSATDLLEDRIAAGIALDVLRKAVPR